MSRRERARALLEIVAERPVHTQAELVRALAERGIEVTQATVSRDIKRLGIVKAPGEDGAYRYVTPETPPAPPTAAAEALRSAFEEFVIGVDVAQGILVVRTYAGCANAVGIAIDEAEVPGVAATLAGDDTIFVLAEDGEARDRVRARFEALLG